MDDKPNGINLMASWPAKILSPNARVHWARLYRAKKDAKEEGYYTALEQCVTLDQENRYRVDLIFCPPDRRKRDLDNLGASMKAFLDGMCAGLEIDDSHIRPVPDWGPVVKYGKVEVNITEIKK